jgi:hypothetical protein
MHFQAKNTWKSNRYHTPKQPYISDPDFEQMESYICLQNEM